MKIGVFGRSELLLDFINDFIDKYEIAFIVTGKASPEYKSDENDYKKFAEDNNIPFLITQSFNHVDYLKFINQYSVGCDIAISMNFPTIIPKEVIDLFALGILNAHGGDLPRYKGNACQAWAILNKEEKIGLCIHKMTPELDSGDIIERSYLPIDISTRIGEVYDWFETEIPSLFKKAIEKLEKNPSYILEKQSLDQGSSLRCYPRNPEDGRINWAQSAEDILRLINASSEPYSGAYCFYKNKKVIVWEAKLNKNYPPYLGVPGQVTHIDKNNKTLDIITGNGNVTLIRVEIENDAHSICDKIKSVRDRLK